MVRYSLVADDRAGRRSLQPGNEKSWCVGMADEADSKSVVGNHVWVQVPPPALIKKTKGADAGFRVPPLNVHRLMGD